MSIRSHRRESCPWEKGTVRKYVYLARHGQGEHNVAAAAAQDAAHVALLEQNPAAPKPPLSDPSTAAYFNAGLTAAGRAQVAEANAELGELLERSHYPKPTVVYSSPLHRTLETASILAKGHVARPIVAVDVLRERRGGNPCDERAEASVAQRDFPACDLSRVVEADAASRNGFVLRDDLIEDDAAVERRAAGVLDWVRELPETSIALVAHRFFLRAMISKCLRPVLDAAGGALEDVFRASEVRVLEMTWTPDGTLAKVVARSLGDAIREADAATLEVFAEGKRALGAVERVDIAARVEALQAKACEALFAGECAAGAFKDIKGIAASESARLSELVASVMDMYAHLAERYKFLEAIPEGGKCPVKQVLPVGGRADAKRDVRSVRLLLAKAARLDDAFREKVEHVVTLFNGAASTADLAQRLGIDTADWPLDIRGDKTGRLSLPGADKTIVARLRFGPPKSLGRALEKELGSLKDLNRCTIECQDPYVAALLLAALKIKFPVVAVKNKHMQTVYEQPPDIHINVDLGGGFLGEIQIILTYCLVIKETVHNYYKLSRAETADLICEPIFKSWMNASAPSVSAPPSAQIATPKAAAAKTKVVATRPAASPSSKSRVSPRMVSLAGAA